MQRVLCMRGNGSDATVVALRVARRWLRKRPSLPMSPLAASAAAPPLPSPSSSPVHDERTATATAATRAGETPSHTSSTLERIRAEVRAMHREAQAAAAARRAASEQQQQQQQRQEQQADTTAATHHDGRSRADALDAALRDALRRRHKPSSAYYVGDDVRASVAAARQLSQRTLEQEAAEVLRRVSRDDVQHYLRLAFPQRSHTAAAAAAAATSSHGSHSNNDDGNSRAASVAAVARALEARVQAAKAAVRARNNNDNNDAACARLSERDVATLAWLEVLEAMSDAQLRQLRDCGLLDANAIEELCAPSTEAAELHTRVTTAATTHEQQQQQPRVARDSDDGDGDDGDDDDTLALDATLRAVQSLQHLGELTRDVCETMLRRALSPDVAPAMQKVRNRQHDDVTARELQMLEAYEETTLPLRVRHTSNNSNSNNNDNSDNDNDAATTATTHMTTLHVTPSLLDRALLPSNWLLDAVAQHDATLRRGLDHLERIKRTTLLDADFQDALRVAHALEAPLLASVRAQVGLAPPQQQQQSSPRRLHMTTTTTTTTTTVRASPVRPYHAADLPYFMHSPRSIVPPHAHFNLPAPALSAHERAIARGRRRRAHGRRRFAK